MKTYYLLFIFTFTYSLSLQAQTDCDNANYYLVSAYSHVKDSYDSRNISHLKYYANRSLESLKLSKKALSGCKCDTAVKLASNASDLLIKVEDAETWEDGRFFVKRARDISKESVIAIDQCTANMQANDVVTNNIELTTTGNSELADLQNEQLKLKQEQDALKLKQDAVKKKLALQKEKELQLEKQVLTLAFKKNIAKQIKTYNETLNISGCQYNSLKPIKSFEDAYDATNIKTHYLNYLKALADNYINQLSTCNP